MPNEKQVNVLTDGELNDAEEIMEFAKLSLNIGADVELTPTFTDNILKIIASHRTLNSRNAKLVHENDELMAENEKLKAALIRERDDALIWDGITVVNRINKILEELNHE